MATKIPKYRPSLTAIQIQHILRLCKENVSETSITIIKILAPMQAKIDNDAINPAYTMEDKPDLYDFLAGNDINTNTTIPMQDKVKYNKWCYDRYKIEPASCSLSEIQAAKEHMYVNDLMTPGEENEWEKENSGE